MIVLELIARQRIIGVSHYRHEVAYRGRPIVPIYKDNISSMLF